MNNFQKNLLKEYFRLILSERKHGEVGRIHQNIHQTTSDSHLKMFKKQLPSIPSQEYPLLTKEIKDNLNFDLKNPVFQKEIENIIKSREKIAKKKGTPPRPISSRDFKKIFSQKLKNFKDQYSNYKIPVDLVKKLDDYKKVNAEGGGPPIEMYNEEYSLFDVIEDYFEITNNREDQVFFNFSLNHREGPTLKKESVRNLKPGRKYMEISGNNVRLAFAFEFFDSYFYKGNFVKDFIETQI